MQIIAKPPLGIYIFTTPAELREMADKLEAAWAAAKPGKSLVVFDEAIHGSRRAAHDRCGAGEDEEGRPCCCVDEMSLWLLRMNTRLRTCMVRAALSCVFSHGNSP